MKITKHSKLIFDLIRYIAGLTLLASPVIITYFNREGIRSLFSAGILKSVLILIPIIIGLYFMVTSKFRARLDITLILISIIALTLFHYGAISGIFLGVSSNGLPSQLTQLSEIECVKHINFIVSGEEFGKKETEFSKLSGIYPRVENNITARKCSKSVSAILYDTNKTKLMSKSYGLYPFADESTTGFGNYNENSILPLGNYTIDGYYGETLIKSIEVKIK